MGLNGVMSGKGLAVFVVIAILIHSCTGMSTYICDYVLNNY
jgi:succinate dehydrogenase hydrophobic anchor subunit